jgi:hypothetical protein
MPQSFSLDVLPVRAASPAWWWYWARTEEASVLA